MPSVVRPCSCSIYTTLHTGFAEEGFFCRFLSLLLYMFASISSKHCGLDSKIPNLGVRCVYLINTPHGVMGSAPRIDLTCRLMRRSRLSRLPASLRSHYSLLRYHATVWTHAPWTALMLSCTTQYIFVRVRSLASAALACVTHCV
jgi:hypothetical protein